MVYPWALIEISLEILQHTSGTARNTGVIGGLLLRLSVCIKVAVCRTWGAARQSQPAGDEDDESFDLKTSSLFLGHMPVSMSTSATSENIFTGLTIPYEFTLQQNIWKWNLYEIAGPGLQKMHELRMFWFKDQSVNNRDICQSIDVADGAVWWS